MFSDPISTQESRYTTDHAADKAGNERVGTCIYSYRSTCCAAQFCPRPAASLPNRLDRQWLDRAPFQGTSTRLLEIAKLLEQIPTPDDLSTSSHHHDAQDEG